MPFWFVSALGALGVFAGANLAFQAVLLTKLRTFVGSPLRASFVSYLGGTLVCALALFATRQSLDVSAPAIRANWWLWTGGLYGLVYLAIAVWLIPRLGTATVVALVVAGQMLAALTFDHFGLFGIPPRPIDASKMIATVLLVAAVVLIRR
jgi:transporter family-2 protein